MHECSKSWNLHFCLTIQSDLEVLYNCTRTYIILLNKESGIVTHKAITYDPFYEMSDIWDLYVAYVGKEIKICVFMCSNYSITKTKVS